MQAKRPWWKKEKLNVHTAQNLLTFLEEKGPWETQDHKLYKRLEMFNSANAYAEPGCSLGEGQKAILFGNWNNLSSAGFDLLEEQYALEWCDEWSTCSECGKAYRTSSDSFCWSPASYYSEGACDERCVVCITEDPLPYLEEVTQDKLSSTIVEAIIHQGLPESWDLLEDSKSFNGEPSHAERHYKEEGFDKVLCLQVNNYSIKWILGYKEEENEENV